MPNIEPEVVATSIWRHLLSRMNVVHSHRSMGAFAGPPGIGKSTAVNSFAAANAGAVAVVRIRQPNAKPVLVQQRTLEAIRKVTNSPNFHEPSSKRELERALDGALRNWSDLLHNKSFFTDEYPKLTLVFDEAQTLSPLSIETLRFWNDGSDELYPIAMVFVGNHEFRLEDGAGGPSFLSAAVSSRTPYRKTFSYQDVSDEDMSLIIQARSEIEPDALALLLLHCRARWTNRDLRRFTRDLDELIQEASGAAINTAVVRTVLGIA